MNEAGVTPREMLQQWQFSVEIDGFNAAYFSKADVPKIEFDEVSFDPAGSAFSQKLPGRAKFDDITLEKGIPADTRDDAAYAWMTDAMDFANATGGPSTDYLKDIAIVEYDRAGQEVHRWNLHGAWVKKYDPGSREGKNSEVAMETLTIAYQYYTKE